jgi:DNA-binding beta-propeller fold protein YncE
MVGGACNKATTSSKASRPLSDGNAYPLPGVSGAVTLDLLAYDRATGQVWIPVGETGSVDVFTIATSTFSRVSGFKTAEREARGRKRTMGPSAAAVGEGFVYVSDRASNEVCVVSDMTLALGACLQLSSPPDVIAYIAGPKEVWVTTPKDDAIVVLDASKPDALQNKAVIKTDGAPECYAVDATRGLFYTNLEDKNRTLAIDIQTHAVKATWTLDCGEAGPRGIAVDAPRSLVFVACTDGLEVRDAAHDGALLGKLDTGAGVDDIDYLDDAKRLYVAASKAARLSIVQFTDRGVPSLVRIVGTAPGARNAVVDSSGVAYVVDPETARLLVLR